jgi:MarR family transcriptional regulator for hemolysin
MTNINLENPDIDMLIEFLCIDTVNMWRNKLGNLAKDFGLSRLERRIILFIGRHPSIRQAELAERMDVEPQSLTRSLEAMEQKGWIHKGEDLKDKRAKSLNLTDVGQKKLADTLAISEKIRPTILHGISEEDRINLSKMLSIMKENLKKV